MKVLVDCIPLSVGGGVQVAIALLANLAAQDSVQWQAVLPDGMKPALPQHLLDDGRLRFLEKRSQLSRLILPHQLHTLVRETAPDVVFTVFGPQFFRAKVPHLVGFALPHLIYDRDPEMPSAQFVVRAADRVREATFRRADHLVVETQTASERLSERLGVDPGRISVVPNSPNPLLKRDSDLGRGTMQPFAVLVPSAYYWHKNLEILPAVAAAIRQLRPGLAFEFRLTLPADGPDWRRIAALADNLGVGDAVKTLGVLKITELSAAYRGASAVLLPTSREVSTAVYPESFFFCRPLVTSDMDFAHELCGDAALFASVRDAEAYARHLIELATRPELRNQLVQAGERQLARGYPVPREKFRMQLDLLEKVAVQTKTLPTPTAMSRNPDGESSLEKMTTDSDTERIADVAVAFHDGMADDWDAKYISGGFLRRAEFIDRELMPKNATSQRWLDAGCGSGFFSRQLASLSADVTGVDASASMIAAARRHSEGSRSPGSMRFESIATIEDLPYASDSFDGVICLSVLEYLSRPFDCIDELTRVIRPGGKLIVSVPHRKSFVRAGQWMANLGGIGLVRKRWRYASLSRFSLTPVVLRETLVTRGFVVDTLVGFDALIPASIHFALPPSLMFIAATKVRNP